jgi:hypothetical protein
MLSPRVNGRPPALELVRVRPTRPDSAYRSIAGGSQRAGLTFPERGAKLALQDFARA